MQGVPYLNKMNKKTWIAVGVISLIILTVSVSVYRQVFAKGPSVKITKMIHEEISEKLMVPGTVKLQEEQVIYTSPEKGEVKEFFVQEGQSVKSGTVLAKLENPQLDLEIEQNKLAIETAKLKISQMDKQIKQLKDKERTLIEQVGKKEAKKQLDPEFDRLELEKELANLDLKQANLQKDLLAKRQSELEIKSTIDGFVLTINKQVVASGQLANSEPLIHIGKMDGMNVTGLLSEYDTLKVQVGQKVHLRSDALTDQKWQGEISNIGILPEKTSQTGMPNETQAVQYPITVKINGELKDLKPGFQVIMEIETEKKMAAVLPIDAIHDDGNGSYVFLVKDGIIRKQKVKTGVASGQKIEILEGVTAKDRVVVNGPDKMKDGMEVTVK
ncbi:efflux RND transporter periplasmic adaptor subunit [Neobacillus thermocopriae]